MKIKIESERGPTPTASFLVEAAPPTEEQPKWRGTILDDNDAIIWISEAHGTCLEAIHDVWSRAASLHSGRGFPGNLK